MNGYFTSLFYTDQVLSLPRVSRVRTNKSHEEISILFFFLKKKNLYEVALCLCRSIQKSRSIRFKIIGSSAKKKKNSEAVTGYILELYVYFTQSFKILCRRRLLILRELDVRYHFLAIFAFFRRRALYKDIVYGTKYHI